MRPQATTALYMRVSTADKQTHASQRTVLQDYCRQHALRPDAVRWYPDKITGATLDRPQLKKLLRAVERGDINTVVVTRLDRLSRSLRDGLDVLRQLTDAGVRLVAVQQNLEFSGAMGKFLNHLFLALSEYERDLIRSRIREGVQAAREKGKRLGRPRDEKRLAAIRRMYEASGPQPTMAHFGFTRQALYKALSKTIQQVA